MRKWRECKLCGKLIQPTKSNICRLCKRIVLFKADLPIHHASVTVIGNQALIYRIDKETMQIAL